MSIATERWLRSVLEKRFLVPWYRKRVWEVEWQQRSWLKLLKIQCLYYNSYVIAVARNYSFHSSTDTRAEGVEPGYAKPVKGTRKKNMLFKTDAEVKFLDRRPEMVIILFLLEKVQSNDFFFKLNVTSFVLDFHSCCPSPSSLIIQTDNTSTMYQRIFKVFFRSNTSIKWHNVLF